MKKFTFRLQRVLDLREIQEKAKLSDLGRERTRMETEADRLRLFRQEEAGQVEQMRKEQSAAFRNWNRHVNQSYLGRVRRVIQFQEQAVQAQEGAVDQAQHEYLEAHRDTQSLERFYDRQLNDWKAETAREEGKILDEHGARRHNSGEAR